MDFPDHHIEGMLEGTQRTGIAYAHVRIRGPAGGVEHTVLPIEYEMRVRDGSYVMVGEPMLLEPMLETAASDSPRMKFMKEAARRLETPSQTFAESAENAGVPEDQITAQYTSAVIEACEEVSAKFYNAVRRVIAKKSSNDAADTIPNLQIVR
ncbi:hypothetical protein KY362_00770 [Candidatus Woesearchaeota archaeon]|nr:hypothetical protein [Candidatus Woesearchaeota archaeon]